MTSSKGDCPGRFLSTVHPPLGKTQYFQLQLGYSVKLSVSGFVSKFDCFLKKCNNLFRKFAGTLGWYYTVLPKCIKLFLHLSLSPGDLFWSIFCSFLCIVTVLCSSISWEPFKQFVDVLIITQRVTSPKKPFHRISPSAGSQFEIFWDSIWGMLLYSWELFQILSYEILYKHF